MTKKAKKIVVCAILASVTVLPVCAEYELLKSIDPVVRMQEAQRLGNEIVMDAVPELIELLSDEYTGVRTNAIVALKRIGNPQSIDGLITVLNSDPAMGPRIMAAQALGKFRDKRVQKALLKAVDSENENLRAAAVRSLGKVGDEKSVKKLIEIVKNDESESVRQAAVTALTEITELGYAGDNRKYIEKIVKKAKKDKSKKVKDAGEKAKKRLDRVPKDKKK